MRDNKRKNKVISGMASCCYFNPLLLLTLILGFGVVISSVAFAGATPNINSEVEADFGDVEHSAGATGNVDMGSDGLIIYPGGFSGSALGVAGQFRIQITGFGAGSANYTIACDDAGAIVSNGGGSTLPIEMDFVTAAGSRTTYGAGNACNGLGATYGPYTGTPRNIYIGTRINIAAPLAASGIYSTSNAGGSPVTFEVIVL